MRAPAPSMRPMTTTPAAAAAPFLGIDFGTTNTSLGLAAADGSVHLARLPGRGGGETTTWRTVLYFDPDATVLAGAPAIDRYAETEGEGRLIQSIKSHLASAAFTRTMIFGKTWTLESLIAEFLRRLRAAGGAGDARRAVVGRPVRYWGASGEADDARALGRMRAALAAAGFADVVFEFEPIAAALRYASKLDHEELVLVADFGGGTSDFSLVRVGPRVAPGDASAILGTGGLAVGGDAFDARIIDAVVGPALGRDTSYRDAFGAVTVVPTWLFARLRRWHHLSFLKDADTLRLLERLEQGALAPERIDRLVRVVKEDLGLALHQSVEAGKQALSSGEGAELSCAELDLALPLQRAAFEDWIAPELDGIDAVIASVLERAGVGPGDVDTVFATGGSSLVPAVRRRLSARFGDGQAGRRRRADLRGVGPGRPRPPALRLTGGGVLPPSCWARLRRAQVGLGRADEAWHAAIAMCGCWRERMFGIIAKTIQYSAFFAKLTAHHVVVDEFDASTNCARTTVVETGFPGNSECIEAAWAPRRSTTAT